MPEFDLVGKLDKLKEYTVSAQNKKRCEPFFAEVGRINRFIAQDWELPIKKCSEHTCQFSFGLAGMNIHRGIKTPNLLSKIILPKTELGRLSRSKKFSRSMTYRYGTDKRGTLRTVDKFVKGINTQTEYIFYKNDNVYGITRDSDNNIIGFSAEKYIDNDLKYYSTAQISPSSGKTELLEKTFFYYNSFGVEKACNFRFNPESSYLYRSDYIFYRTKTGTLKEYQIIDHYPDGKRNRFQSPQKLRIYLDY